MHISALTEGGSEWPEVIRPSIIIVGHKCSTVGTIQRRLIIVITV